MNIDNIIKIQDKSDDVGIMYKLTILRFIGFNITYLDGDPSGGNHLGFGFCLGCFEIEFVLRLWSGNAA